MVSQATGIMAIAFAEHIPLSLANHTFPAFLDIFLTVRPHEVKIMTKDLHAVTPKKGSLPWLLSRNTLNYR